MFNQTFRKCFLMQCNRYGGSLDVPVEEWTCINALCAKAQAIFQPDLAPFDSR